MKHKSYILLFILFCAFTDLMSQTAPDFTVTDSWGNTHRLYEDYLNQGKTVVLKIFYVACPPCNSIAPLLEPLYQEWGGGEADVQFIELSIQQGDSDAEINVYKNNHATTYPAAGGEGNSVSASTPYTNGTFGPWSGTPTFVVIAPNGTLQYDVFGFGNAGTIDALDAAIEATGATGVSTGISDNNHPSTFSILSTVVREELLVNITNATSDHHISITGVNGVQFYKSKIDYAQMNLHSIDVSFLPDGFWICTIANNKTGARSSIVFIKS